MMRTMKHCLPLKDWGRPSFMSLGMNICATMPVITAVCGRGPRAAVITVADAPPSAGGWRRLVTPLDRRI